jgi:ABC-type sugar transport system substrate-binding protein
MRIIVCGGRNYTDHEAVSKALLAMWFASDRPKLTIVQGGAQGADECARQVAATQNFLCETFRAEWDREGNAAGPRRNQRMVNAGADLLVAFPGGRGTADCVRRARKAGIPVVEMRSSQSNTDPKRGTPRHVAKREAERREAERVAEERERLKIEFLRREEAGLKLR